MFAHATSSRHITIECSIICEPTQSRARLSQEYQFVRTKSFRDILELFLKRRLVELLANSELAVDSLLGDVETLHVEKPVFAHGLDERLGQFLVSLRRAVLAQVNRDEISPVEILL